MLLMLSLVIFQMLVNSTSSDVLDFLDERLLRLQFSEKLNNLRSLSQSKYLNS